MTLSWDLNRLNAQISLNKNGKKLNYFGFWTKFQFIQKFCIHFLVYCILFVNSKIKLFFNPFTPKQKICSDICQIFTT